MFEEEEYRAESPIWHLVVCNSSNHTLSIFCRCETQLDLFLLEYELSIQHLTVVAFIAIREYYDASPSIQFPATISSMKAVDMYYKSTKTHLQIHTLKIQAIKRDICTSMV